MRIRWTAAVAGIALLVGVVALSAGLSMRHHEEAVIEHPVTIPAAAREITVSHTMPGPSRSARHLSAMLEEGPMPNGRTMAEVMSDTECTPDARMISRCRNEMRLQDGTTIVVRHPHDMRHVPCLAPGEQVLLVPSSA